jgi:hypothetical protein
MDARCQALMAGNYQNAEINDARDYSKLKVQDVRLGMKNIRRCNATIPRTNTNVERKREIN